MSGKKKLTQMNIKELKEATSEFDEEFVADTFHEPSPKARQQWENASGSSVAPFRARGPFGYRLHRKEPASPGGPARRQDRPVAL